MYKGEIEMLLNNKGKKDITRQESRLFPSV